MNPAGMDAPLLDRFDALLFDLDGVVYVGPSVVAHAAESIAAARGRGVACVFVTNNAARPPETVAEHLTAIGVTASVDDVVTSPQAAVTLLAAYVPAGARVLVIGGAGIAQALRERGYEPVASLDDNPVAVVQGYSPDLSWRDLAEATFAVRTGLPWIATNPDLTFPTPRGVAPGNGSLVEVVARTVGRGPDAVAGKPEPALLREAIARVRSTRPLMVGDRLDTDIAAGTRVNVPSLLVFTGVTTLSEVLAAVPHERPDYLAHDLRALLEPYPEVVETPEAVTCGGAVAVLTEGSMAVVGSSGTKPWDAVRAAARLAWRCADAGRPIRLGEVADVLADAVGVPAR